MCRGALIFILLFTIQGICQQKYSEQYKKGIQALSIKDTSSAEISFEESIHLYNDAPSFFELGKIKEVQNSSKFRNSALYNLKKAANLEPGNLEYRLEYASLLEKVDLERAFQEYENLVEVFPSSIKVLVKSGMMNFQFYYKFKNSKGIRNIGREIDHREDAKKYFESAEKLFFKALKIDTLSGEALSGLGCLYFHSKYPENAIQYLNRLCSVSPYYKAAHVMLGCIYNNINKLKLAQREFQIAFDLMDKEEKNDFLYSSVIELLKPQYYIDEHYDLKRELEQLIERFWKAYDPSDDSEINERELEHYARVAFTGFNYNLPQLGIKGWQTERGQVYIRFGSPDSIQVIQPFRGYPLTEIWIYKDFTLSFGNYKHNGNLVLTGDNESNPYCIENSYTLYEDLIYTNIQNYKPKGVRLDINSGLYLFKDISKDDQDFVEAYYIYGSPIKDKIGNLNLFSPEYNYSLTIYDWELDTLFNRTENIDKKSIDDLLQEKKNPLKTLCINFKLPIDKGVLSFKMMRLSDKICFSNQVSYNIAGFNPSEISMSDLLMAAAVDTDKEITGAIKRKNISIVPILGNVFKKSDPVYLYYEIYGLNQGKDNLTDFEHEITICEHKIEEKKSGFSSVIKSIVNFLFGKKNTLSLSSSYRTKEENPQQYIQLDFSKYEPGEYDILLTVTDKISGKKIEKSSIVQLISDNKKL